MMRHPGRLLAGALLAVVLLTGCGPAEPAASPGPALAASPAPPSGPGPTSGPAVDPPAGTIRLTDLRVGQNIELELPRAPGWSQPRSTNPAVVAVTDLGATGDWKLRLTLVGPGSAAVRSQLDPCYGQTDRKDCAGAGSAKSFSYVEVAVASG